MDKQLIKKFLLSANGNTDIDVEVKCLANNEVGIATMRGNNVSLFIGSDDGSDDKNIPYEQFVEEYELVRIVMNCGNGISIEIKDTDCIHLI